MITTALGSFICILLIIIVKKNDKIDAMEEEINDRGMAIASYVNEIKNLETQIKQKNYVPVKSLHNSTCDLH